jgi:predicted RNA-binding protein
MCEANVYLIDKEGKERLLMESVDKILPGEEGIFLENIFSERKTVKAKIKEMALVEHKILLEEIVSEKQNVEKINIEFSDICQ